MSSINLPKTRGSRPYVQASTHFRYKWEVVVPGRFFGKRIRRRTNSKPEADMWLRDYEQQIARNMATPLTKEEHLLIYQFRNHLSMSEMTAAFESAVQLKADRSLSVNQIAQKYLVWMQQRYANDAISHSTLIAAEQRVTPFYEGPFSRYDVNSLTRADVQRWFDALPGALRTKKNQLNELRAVLNFGRAEGLILAPDPTAAVSIPIDRVRNVGIVPPDDMEKLLTACYDLYDASDPAGYRVYWWLVFGGFMGLRSSEISRLDWSDVQPAAEHASNPGELYVAPGKTANAERWVTFTPPLELINWSDKPEKGLIIEASKTTSDRDRAKVYGIAGVSIPVNGLRHSYGSHHLVKFREQYKTASEMGHASVSTTYRHYRRAVSPSQAEQYWDLPLRPLFTAHCSPYTPHSVIAGKQDVSSLPVVSPAPQSDDA